mgnify:FL=1
MKIKDIIKEEVQKMLEASMTKGFRKAVEALQDIQLKQQKLRKAFVAEKNPKKKEKLKQALIKMHKVVQKAELDFNRAISNEPVDLDETKSAPSGHYFTKSGNVVKGRLTKDARAKGARKSDPKDKQRSKVPPATQRNEEDVNELDVRKTHGDRRIENPKTGNDIKLRTALKAKKGSQVYQTARKIYNRLKDKE